MKSLFEQLKIIVLGVMICIVSCSYIYANDGIEVAGDVLAYLLPATAGGMTIVHKDGKGALQLGASTALTLGSVFALKYTVREERPNHDDHYSFPSAHSSVAFSSAEFIRKRYGWECGIPAHGVAALVAFSRVQAKQHYVNDVIVGAAIGIGSSYLFTTPYKGWYAQPLIDTKFYGIRLSRNW